MCGRSRWHQQRKQARKWKGHPSPCTVFLAEVCSRPHLFINSATNKLFADMIYRYSEAWLCFLLVYHLLPCTVELRHCRLQEHCDKCQFILSLQPLRALIGEGQRKKMKVRTTFTSIRGRCNCCNNCSHDSCAKTCLLVSLGNNLTIFPRSLLSNSHHVWVSFFFAGEVYHLPRMLRAPSMNLHHVSLENENGARL